MKFSRIACSAVLVFGIAHAAAGQTPTGTSGTSGLTTAVRGTAGAAAQSAAPIDVSRLPINLRRIEERFRQSRIQEEHRGLDLRYFVEVFAPAPKLVLFTPADNLEKGQAPYGGPTHAEMLDMITPRYTRQHGGVDLLNRR